MLDKALRELRDNQRLRWMVALVALVLAVYGVLLLRDSVQAAQQEHRTVAQGITRLRSQLAQAEWPARVAPAKTLAVQLESRLWQAPTAGLAQAAMQDWLREVLARSKATRVSVTVTVLDEIVPASADPSAAPRAVGTAGGAVPTPPDLWKIRAKVGFDYTTPALVEFLLLVEGSDKRVLVEGLTVKKAPPTHVEADLVAYFQRQGSGLASAEGARPALNSPPVATPGAIPSPAAASGPRPAPAVPAPATGTASPVSR